MTLKLTLNDNDATMTRTCLLPYANNMFINN